MNIAKKYYIGIDNGVTGSVGIVCTDATVDPIFIQTPIFKEQDYTKKRKRVSRINIHELKNVFEPFYQQSNVKALIERPMINSHRFTASISAARALEATLILLEAYQIPREFIDSKKWQREMLPRGIKGAANLKQASREIGARMFPQFAPFNKSEDADGILIAEWGKRNNL